MSAMLETVQSYLIVHNVGDAVLPSVISGLLAVVGWLVRGLLKVLFLTVALTGLAAVAIGLYVNFS